MSQRIEFRCGHTQAFDERQASPRCACGETVVARTSGFPPPRIVGCASGPFVTTQALPAMAVSLGVSDGGQS